MNSPSQIEFEEGGDNVFADIGFDEVTATQLSHKSNLVGVLYRAQQERNLSQAAFGRLIGIPQARLSKLYNGKIDGISTDKLLDAIARVGGHVLIRVEPHPERPETAGRVELELA